MSARAPHPRRMNKHTLHQKFIVVLLGVLTLLFAAMLLTAQISARTVTGQIVNENEYARQEKIDRSLVSIMDEVTYLHARIAADERLFELQNSGSASLFAEIVGEAGVNGELFANVVLSLGGRLFDDTGETALPSPGFLKSVEESSAALTDGGISENCLVLGTRLSAVSSVAEGVVVFYLKERMIASVFGDMDASAGYGFLLSSDHRIVSHPDPGLAGSTVFEKSLFPLGEPSYLVERVEGVKSVVVISPMETLGEKYGMDYYAVSVLDYGVMNKSVTVISRVLALAATVILAVTVFFAVRTAKKTTRPINMLSSALSEVTKTGTRSKLGFGSEGDELYQLEKTYDEMIDRIFDLVEENKRKVELQRKLELDALQMQINPHFLYNTLDAIAWMAKIKRQPDIEKLVINLARFFRISLHNGDKFITVREEVELVKTFIEIELVRFPDQFTIDYDVAEEVADCSSLKLILQPIVENAVKHGISQLDRMGHLSVRAFGEGEDIVYRVTDDGVGFDTAAPPKPSRREGGYGLKNVDERIKLDYGPDYGVTVQSRPGQGTTVTVRIARR